MNHEESKIQAEIVKYLAHVGIFCHLVGNDAAGSNARQQGTLITLGLKPGVSDLIVWIPLSREVPCYRVRIVYLELKTPAGKQSPSQVKFEARCNAHGVDYRLARSLDDVITLVDWYAEHG